MWYFSFYRSRSKKEVMSEKFRTWHSMLLKTILMHFKMTIFVRSGFVSDLIVYVWFFYFFLQMYWIYRSPEYRVKFIMSTISFITLWIGWSVKFGLKDPLSIMRWSSKSYVWRSSILLETFIVLAISLFSELKEFSARHFEISI